MSNRKPSLGRLASLVTLAGLLAATGSAQDLVVSKLSASHGTRTLSPGSRTTLTSVITNVRYSIFQATTAANASAYFYSTDSRISSRDRLLRAWTTPKLSSNSSHQYSATITMPSDVPNGTCYLGCWADYRNAVKELSDSNNTRALAVKTANFDLVADYVSSDQASISQGLRVKLSSRIRNQGSLASPATESAYYLSNNSLISTSDTLLGAFPTPALLANQVQSHSSTYTMPATNHRPELAYIGVIADHRQALAEADRSNNVKSISIRTEGEPIVRIDSVRPSVTDPVRGSTVRLRIALQNSGRKASPASRVSLWFKSHSGAPSGSNDWQLPSVPLPSISPNSWSTVYADIVVPSEICPSYRWYVRADAFGTSRETTLQPRWPSAPGYYIGQAKRSIERVSTDRFPVCTKRVGTLPPNTFYIFVWGCSGTTPGIRLPVGTLPINFDWCTNVGFAVHGSVFQKMLGLQDDSAAGQIGEVLGGTWLNELRGKPTWFGTVYFGSQGLVGVNALPAIQMNVR